MKFYIILGITYLVCQRAKRTKKLDSGAKRRYVKLYFITFKVDAILLKRNVAYTIIEVVFNTQYLRYPKKHFYFSDRGSGPPGVNVRTING